MNVLRPSSSVVTADTVTRRAPSARGERGTLPAVTDPGGERGGRTMSRREFVRSAGLAGLGALMVSFAPFQAPRAFVVSRHERSLPGLTRPLRLALLTDMHLVALGNRTNQIMRVLTIIATVFIPLTFIAGVYGMNFRYMPELALPWAYPVVLGLMAGIALGMVAYFRRRRWL